MKDLSDPKRLPTPPATDEGLDGEELARSQAIEVATIRARALIAEGYLDQAEEALLAAVGKWGEHAELERLLNLSRSERKRQTLIAHPAELVEYVKTMWAEDDLPGAIDLLRQALHRGVVNPEIPALLGQIQLELRQQQEERAWLAMMSETRVQIERQVELGEIAEAHDALTRIESLHGPCEELEDLGVWLRHLRREQERIALASHLSEAQRLRDEDRLQESLEEARKALALEPQNHEARALVDSLTLEMEERELEAAARLDADHIHSLLARGRLLRAELALRKSRRQDFEYLPARRHQLLRCRRLRATRWATRWARVRKLSPTIPVDSIRALPSSAFQSAAQLWSRGWEHASQKARTAAESTRLRTRVLVVSAGLVVLAAAGFYSAADVRDRHEPVATQPTEVPPEQETLAPDPGPAVTVGSPGDLILDALPWGRVVAIVGPDGQEEDLGESLFTPVRLSLPAGSYRVILENPTVERPADFWVQVSPSIVKTKVYEFEPVDADAYFEKTW